MAWKIRMMSGHVYTVGDKEAENARKAMLGGGIVVLSMATVNGRSIEAIEDEITNNPIINDEIFSKWIEGDMRSLDLLNNRYSGEKYEKEWKQALDHKKNIESGEIKSLE